LSFLFDVRCVFFFVLFEGSFSVIGCGDAEGVRWVKKVGPLVARLLKGKGGGRDNRYNGKAEDLRFMKDMESILKEAENN
jgi:hypothetical protein